MRYELPSKQFNSKINIELFESFEWSKVSFLQLISQVRTTMVGKGFRLARRPMLLDVDVKLLKMFLITLVINFIYFRCILGKIKNDKSVGTYLPTYVFTQLFDI